MWCWKLYRHSTVMSATLPSTPPSHIYGLSSPQVSSGTKEAAAKSPLSCDSPASPAAPLHLLLELEFGRMAIN